jgi:hypothetical protein
MSEDVVIPWLLYRPPIWTVLLAALAPAAVAHFRRRSPMRWYLYGLACTLVALAPHRAGDNPCPSCPFADRIA